MFDKLEIAAARLEELNRQLMDPDVVSDPKRLMMLTKEHSQLEPVVRAFRDHQRMERELVDAREMLTEEDDAEMRELARAEVTELEEQIAASVEQLRLLMLPKDPYEGRPLLLELRAGTGGDEAGLFAADLFRMYQRYAEKIGVKLSLLSVSEYAVGGAAGKTAIGYKEVVASASGDEAYAMFRFEGGVHRVQRVPLTETQGRIHTSTATVAVLPEPDEVEVDLNPQDLRIDTMRAGGPGGQSVNTTDSAVRIVHIPTGLIVQCQDEKSQLKNKEKAMRVLKARLLEQKRAEAHAEEASARKAQVGSGERSEKIRTYNYPQNRVTDHRINLTLYNLDRIVEGDMTGLLDALNSAHQAQLLEALDER